MFSGKSSEMFRQIRRYTVAKKKCLVIKYSFDTRYAVDEASTHDQFKMAATPAVKLFDVYGQAKDCDVIGIDEGQFFPDVVEFSEQMANAGKTIVIACLDGTFQRKVCDFRIIGLILLIQFVNKIFFCLLQPFGRVLELVALAESVTKLTSVCMICQANAAFSKRLGSETAVEVIGGADKYIAVCRACYHSDQVPQQQAAPVPVTVPVVTEPTSTSDPRLSVSQVSPQPVEEQSTCLSPMAATSSSVSLDLTAASPSTSSLTDMFVSPVAKRPSATSVSSDSPIA